MFWFVIRELTYKGSDNLEKNGKNKLFFTTFVVICRKMTIFALGIP